MRPPWPATPARPAHTARPVRPAHTARPAQTGQPCGRRHAGLRPATWMAAVLVATVLAGCSGGSKADDGPWHGRDLAAAGWQQVPIEHGGVYEVMYRAEAGDTITWDWVVPERVRLQFFVHTHDAGGNDVPFNQTVSDEDAGRLVAPMPGYYGVQWTNLERDTRLHVRLSPGGVPAYYGPA